MNNNIRFVSHAIESDFSTGEDFAALFSAEVDKKIEEGTVVKGFVVSIDDENVVVDIGLKMEGFIPAKEFREELNSLKVGDEVDVFLEKIESRNGKMLLSRERVFRKNMWNQLKEAMESGKYVDGKIERKVKGGFTVDLGGIYAFLPGSQVDIRPVSNLSPLIGVDQPFQILKIDGDNIVVSRRAIMEESRAEAKNELLAKIKEGLIMDGVVKNITDYGAFIDLGSIDGLLHLTDISWSRINHPSEVLTIGQQIKVMVIKYNEETKRVSLGMKQLESNPWQGLDQEFVKGVKYKGKVTNITDYGVFIELKPGIEGLVHVSEMSWTKSNLHPRKLVAIGQEVDFVVLDIDVDKHRISLGMKQFNENPWQKFADEHQIGSEVEGFVKNVVDFGLFVGFDSGVDGLIHVSDLTWSDSALQELKKFKKDDPIKAVVLSLDVSKERISLGIKQLNDDPFEKALADIKKGKVVTCKVTNIREDGIEVEVVDGITSFIKRSDLSNDRVEQRPERFAVGDRVDAKVTIIDKVNRKISLSIKAMEADEQKKVIAEFGSTDSGASIGDILGAALNKASQNKDNKE